MNYQECFKLLYDQYRRERNVQSLNEAIFGKLLIMFPSILIAQADGHVDTTEILHLNKMIAQAAGDIPEVPEQDFKIEVRYLTWNSSIWRQQINNCLKLYYQENPSKVEDMIYLMATTAASSTGSLIGNLLISPEDQKETKEFISKDEIEEMSKILSELGLDNDKALAEKLQQLISGPREI